MLDLVTHQEALEDRGITKLPGLIPNSTVETALCRVNDLASEFGLLGTDGWQRAYDRFALPKPFRKALNSLNRTESFAKLVDARITGLAEELLGEAVTPMAPGQQLLFTLPGNEGWAVPNDVWHVDLPRLGEVRSPGLQLFTCLGAIEPKGGGTLAIAGSHRLVNNDGFVRSKDVKQLVQSEPYFKNLFDASRAPINCIEDTRGDANGTVLECVEMSGRPGDAYLMDLRILHTPSANCSNNARIALTSRLPVKRAVERLIG